MSPRSVKFILTLCVILLPVALGLAWHNQRSMVIAEACHAKLVAAARHAGIPADGPTPASTRQKTKRDRPDHSLDAESLIPDIRSVYALFQAKQISFEQRATMVKFMEKINRMSLTQLLATISGIRSSPSLSDEERSQVILMLAGLISQAHPEYLIQSSATVPEIKKTYAESGDSWKRTAFQPWVSKDPVAAGQWAKENLDSLSPFDRLFLLRECAQKDTAHALQLIHELQLENPIVGYAEILANSPLSACEPTLTAARQSLAALPDETSKNAAGRKLFSELARKFERGGYEAGRKWLEAAKLSPAETENLSMSLAESDRLKNPDQWIDWIGSQLPPDKATAPIESLVREWTDADYQAAGKWLTTMPAGPTKNAAVRAYAETVAKADPEVAKQWALTLPPGPEREETLQRIQAK